MTRRAWLGAGLAAPFVRRAHAETSTVVIAKQFGTLYLQQDVMERQRLIEKHAAALGLPGLKVEFLQLSGSTAITDALLSGRLHFASGGAPGAMLLWDRTHGAIKSCFAMNASNQKLVTVRDGLRSIKDLVPTDRIALPAVKVSPQAIWLQMGAVQAFGSDAWSRFDALTVTRAHPDGMAQLLARTEVDCHWAASPFQERELASPGVHEVANSFAVMGLPSVTPNTIYAAAAFRAANPLAWRATVEAFREATDFINREPHQAAEVYLENSGAKDTLANVVAAMGSSGNEFTLQPRGLQKIAAFMAEIRLLRRRPDNLADVFFPEAAELGGS